MKITLPENTSEITLKQYIAYYKLITRTDLKPFDVAKRKVSIFTGIKFHDLDKISQSDFADILLQIEKALNEEAKFINRFTMGGIEFGFIPNFDKITTKEHADLFTYELYNEENEMNVDVLPNIMAILFRPIINSDSFDNYKIAEYNGTSETKDYMLGMPLSVVNGAIFFFLSLSKELSNHILKFTKEVEQRKEKKQAITSISGDGMQLL